MGLEDISMFRALPTATIFYPSDGVSTEKAVELAASTRVSAATVERRGFLLTFCAFVFSLLLIFLCPSTKGVSYIRTSRQESAVIYNSGEDFHVGQAKVRRAPRLKRHHGSFFISTALPQTKPDAFPPPRWCTRTRTTR